MRTSFRLFLVVLTVSLAPLSGCGEDTAAPTNTDMAAGPHGEFHNYATSQILLPTSGTEYAIDLNGDGKVDNQLGLIISLQSLNRGAQLEKPQGV